MLYVSDAVFVVRKQIRSLFKKMLPYEWRYGGKGDIILIPGFAQTWVFFEAIGNYLNILGYRIHFVPALGRNLSPIADSAKRIEAYIVHHKLKRVSLIAHSKGGLIAKYLLDHSTTAKQVNQLVSIATPYRGLGTNYFSLFFLHELKRDSQALRSLSSTKQNSKIVNLYAKYDNRILPNENALLEGAKNIQVDVAGHTCILETKQTMEVLKKYLA